MCLPVETLILEKKICVILSKTKAAIQLFETRDYFYLCTNMQLLTLLEAQLICTGITKIQIRCHSTMLSETEPGSRDRARQPGGSPAKWPTQAALAQPKFPFMSRHVTSCHRHSLSCIRDHTSHVYEPNLPLGK